MAENFWTLEHVQKLTQKVQRVRQTAQPSAQAALESTIYRKGDTFTITVPARPINLSQPAKASKHRNRKTLVGGISFDSAKEAKRWQELSLLEQVGAIRDLRRQVSYDLWACNGERIARYVADAVYHDIAIGKEVREDTKSPWTRKLPVYRLKFKLMQAQGTPITEV